VDHIRKKIIDASIYPVILLSAGLLVTMFLIFYVVPKFSLIYEEIGHDLPLFSRLLMQFGQFCNQNAVLMVVLVIIGVLGIVIALMRVSARTVLFGYVKKIPTVGNQAHIYQLALFYRTVSLLLKSGLHIIPTIDLVGGILNDDLKSNLVSAKESIFEGKSVSSAFLKYGLTTPIALSLIKVGEKTGRLGDMAEYVANYYDEETARWVEWFSKLFEPILMSVIGIMIGLIVVMMYFPIFELAGNMQ
jgi:general secretion pathway protein F